MTLLLSPILKCNKTNTLKPKVVLLCDNSRSINHFQKIALKEEIDALKKEINAENVELELQVFDKSVKPFDSLDQKGTRTDIIEALNRTIASNIDNNLSRIILVTDGNYNLGNNPIFLNNKDYVPIDVVLIGDTSKVSDLRIENLEYNSLMLQDENNPLNVFITTQSAKGVDANVILEEIGSSGNRIIGQTKINSKQDFYSQSVQFMLSSLVKGKHYFRVTIKSSLRERNIKNNTKEFSVEVIDGEKQIEILSSFAHPDISALKAWLQVNKKFKVKAHVSDMNLTFSDEADVLVFYQLPNSIDNGKKLIEKAISKGKSVLFVLGTNTDYQQFNLLINCYKVDLKANIIQDYNAKLNPNFTKFYLSNKEIKGFQSYPPLSNFLLTIESKFEANHLLFSNLGRIDSDRPLLTFSSQDNIQIGVLAAENIWKWRVHNYQTKRNFDETQELFDKIINYLSIMKDKKQLIIQLSNENIPDEENLVINAYTYNEMYQPFKASSVVCTISNGDNLSKKYEMLPLENRYSLTPTDLKAGRYTYEVIAKIGSKTFKDIGSFNVYGDDIEDAYMPSNIEDMTNLAIKSGGSLLMWSDRAQLKTILNKANSKEKIVNETLRLKANDILYLLLGILFLLSAEWLIRKYFGLK